MNSEIKKLPKSEIELTITVTVQEQDPYIKKAAQKLAKDIKIDGFRPGNAPFDVIKSKVGEMQLIQEALDLIINDFYIATLEQNKIVAIGQPKIDVEKLAFGNDLVFKATVSILPSVKIGELNKIKIKRNKVEAQDKEVDKILEDIRKMRAEEKEVDRVAKKGDKVEIDFEVFQDNVPIENGKHEKYPLTIGEGKFIPGFEEKLIGIKSDEEKKFDLKFPDKYHEKKLAGKKATFKVKCHKVMEIKLPELTDKFAKEMSAGKFATLLEMKNNIRENVKQEKEAKEEQRLESEMLNSIVEISEFEDELPEELLKNESGRMMSELEQNVTRQGMKFEDYLKSINKTREELEKDLSPQAMQRAKTAIIAREIYHQQNISVSESEIDEEIKKMSVQYQGNPEAEKMFSTPQYRDYFKNMIGNRKVIEYLKSIIVE